MVIKLKNVFDFYEHILNSNRNDKWSNQPNLNLNVQILIVLLPHRVLHLSLRVDVVL